jgi:hypothetical protein
MVWNGIVCCIRWCLPVCASSSRASMQPPTPRRPRLARRYTHNTTSEDPQPAAYMLWVAPGASITLPLGAPNATARSLMG